MDRGQVIPVERRCQTRNALRACLLRPVPLRFLGLPSHVNAEVPVKTEIHPVYATATVKCACGNTFQTRSTMAELHTDVCAACHPFYTGKQKFLDTAGRIDRFRQKFGKKA